MRLSIIICLCMAIIGHARAERKNYHNYVDGIIGGYEYVDLGLPSGTLWASYNIGATSPYEIGDYFAWGEVESRESFTWEEYAHFDRYEFNQDQGNLIFLKDIGANISGTEYDAASHLWGSGWRLPNETERYELFMKCWNNGPTVENGVSGVRIYGPNGHSIFLPVCGFGSEKGNINQSDITAGAYWTSIEDPQQTTEDNVLCTTNSAKSIFIDLNTITSASTQKYVGLNIRAVVNRKFAGIDNLVTDDQKLLLEYRDGNIYLTGDYSNGEIKVYDLSGRFIYSGNVAEKICPLPILSNGIYLITYFQDGLSILNQKISIK